MRIRDPLSTQVDCEWLVIQVDLSPLESCILASPFMYVKIFFVLYLAISVFWCYSLNHSGLCLDKFLGISNIYH